MKREIETAAETARPDKRTVRVESPSLLKPAPCGNDMAAGTRRPGGEPVPSALAALREFRRSVALLDS